MEIPKCLLSVLIALTTLHCAFGEVIVTTKYGKIRGISSNKTKAFLGVPYAAPPVGKLRYNSISCTVIYIFALVLPKSHEAYKTYTPTSYMDMIFSETYDNSSM